SHIDLHIDRTSAAHRSPPPLPIMPIVHVKSDSDFRKALSSGKLVVIDFYADWCGPCKAIAPRFEELSEQYKGVIFLKVNVDEHTQISQECEITAMPTFQLYRSNKKLDQIVGANIRGVENSIQR
ncbi:putative thioredoxin, partial [Polychytrium aggregatum]|uniref:putative thioredoxin n=1 Tax=Polychytrium aggregatum TaxID=110093 RepID=UPI0022FE26A4